MATPLPTIAINTEETAFAVLEGNVILDTIKVAISDMSKKMTTSIGHLTGAIISFSEMIKEQNAAVLVAASLSAPSTDETPKNDGKKSKDKGNWVDNVIANGLTKGTGQSIMTIAKDIGKWLLALVSVKAAFGAASVSIVRFGRLAGRLFWPLTLIIGSIGAVSASWESFANGDIWGGLEKAVTGFFNSVVTIPLDLIKDGIAWLLKKMGFDKEADLLKDFSFTTEFNKIIEKLFLGLKEAVKAVTDLFSFGEEDKTALGLLGKLTDIIFAPINIAIGFIRGLFGWSEEGAPAFKLQDWITTKVDEAIVWVKGLFSWAGDKIAEGWTNLTNYVSEKWEDIKTWVTDKLTWATDTIGAGWTNLTDFVSGKWEDIKTWVTDKLTWATGTIGAGWTSLTDFVSGKWEDIKTWITDKLTWATDTIGAGWTNLTDFVSGKWEDIKTWVTGKLEWATDTIGAGWTSLTDFVSGKWEDIKTWFGEKLTWATDTVGEGANFISQLVTDAWGSVKQWFTDALAGIADALPSWDDITAGIISRLPSWMVPDSFKTPGMIAAEIKTKIAENQALVDQIDSGQGGNKSWMLDSVERSRALEQIIADQAALAELEATRSKQDYGTFDRGGYGGSPPPASTTQNNAGNTVIMQPATAVGGRGPHRKTK